MSLSAAVVLYFHYFFIVQHTGLTWLQASTASATSTHMMQLKLRRSAAVVGWRWVIVLLCIANNHFGPATQSPLGSISMNACTTPLQRLRATFAAKCTCRVDMTAMRKTQCQPCQPAAVQLLAH
jgi:hypothetical protein